MEYEDLHQVKTSKMALLEAVPDRSAALGLVLVNQFNPLSER